MLKSPYNVFSKFAKKKLAGNFQWLADSRMRVGSRRYNETQSIKIMPPEVEKRADELSTIWDFGVSFLFILSTIFIWM